MCQKCVKQQCPDRGESTYESSVYLVNFNGCGNCSSFDMLESIEKESEVTENEEKISFKHACKKCKHVVAEHEYSFEIIDGHQEYSMSCNLCGFGEASVSIAPYDPRQTQQLY